MRLVVGLFSILGVAGAYAGCEAIEGDSQRLSCFDQMAQCQSLSRDDERLECYQQGGVKGSNKSARTASNSSVAATGVAVTSDAAVEAAFPPPRSRDSVEEEPPEIHSSIVAIQKDARGYYYLTLANGHVWREKEIVRNRYAEGDQVIISKGALDSKRLRIVGKGRMVSVERYK